MIFFAAGDCTIDWHNTTCDYAVRSTEFSRVRAVADVDMQC